jgi:predicted glutamine amidotransferase
MCRWLAYSGAPIALGRLVLDPEHSLIDQSLSSREGVATTNGDGFGIGWYDYNGRPGLYKDTQPAWNDLNLRDLCEHVRSRMFLAHVRAATATLGIQRSNCHPFRHGRWLFMHNGEIIGFHRLRRELLFAVDPKLFPLITGTTDSELMFHLALTFGMDGDVVGGVARMAGFIEEVGRRNGVEDPLQMTLGVSDGERLYAFRYSSCGWSRSLFHSHSMAHLRELAEDEFDKRLEGFSGDARAIVSEPLSDLATPWQEIPEASFVVIEGGEVTREPFAPRAP